MRTLLLLRSLLIQGSWNYRTMLGTGVAWALLPVLRRKSDGSRSVDPHVLKTHAEHFNGHPYLMPLALGALAREELAGTDRDQIRRFRSALPGPLGSLGDALIWAAWRPTCLAAALLVAVLGGGAGWVLAGFLLVYNLVHVALRIWAVRVGWAEGLRVGKVLARGRLRGWTERIGGVGVLVFGLLMGVLLVEGVRVHGWSPLWLMAAVLLLAGMKGGSFLGRVGPVLLLVLVLSGFLWGGMG